jgi:hypothetical protein
MANSDGVRKAGDIDIQEVTLITASGQEFDLTAGYIGELNLFEDIYAQGLYGNILIVDALNLSSALGLTGDEYVRLKLVTPTQSSYIWKTFKIYSITDKIFISDTGKQTFIMHFCSPEVFVDALSPVYKTFKKAKVHEHAKKVFENYLALSRIGTGAYTPMIIVPETTNDIQFTSPGWHPGKILNWLASKAQGNGFVGPNFLFYESNKAYYFANTEALIKSATDSKQYYQDYYVMASKITGNYGNESDAYFDDIDRQYKQVMDMRVIETYNGLKNTQNGYLANRMYTFDVVNKKRTIYDYDHVSSWNQYKHMGNKPPFPTEGSASLRSPAGFNQIYMQHDQLYTGVKNNVGEQAGQVTTRRTSTMAELTNFKLEITVPGRTDAEIGSIVNFHFPNASPKNLTDKSLSNDDALYSGLYLISAIRHQITPLSHTMVLELVRDSLQDTK